MHLHREAPPRRARHPGLLPALLVLAVGAGLSLLAFGLTRSLQRQQVETAFRNDASERIEAIRQGLQHSFEAVLSLRDHLTASGRFEDAAFQAFAGPLHGRHGDLQALQWLPEVTPENRAALESAARVRDPGFRFFTRDPAGAIQVLPADAVFHAVYLVTPMPGNQVTLGYSASQLATRQRALERARQRGELSASGPIRLLQETADQQGFLVMASVPGGNGRPRGVVQGVFRAGDLVRGSVAFLEPKGIDLALYSATGAEPPALLHAEPSGTAGGRLQTSRLRLDRDFELAGRRWTVHAASTNGGYSPGPGWRSWSVLGGGMAFTLLLAVYLRGALGREAEVRALVAERTRALLLESAGHQRDAEALKQSEARFRRLVETMDEGMWILDGDDRTAFHNPRLAAMLGLPRADLAGRGFLEFLAPAEHVRVRGLLENWRAGAASAQDLCLLQADGTELWALVTGTRLDEAEGPAAGLLLMLTDITARRREEVQQLQAQKLRSLGVLAGGIAHDFNNLLAAIQGNLELALLRTSDPAPSRAPLQNIGHAVQRASHLTRQMLAYSGRSSFQVGPLDLNRTVREISHLLGVAHSKRVRLRFELAEGLPRLRGDAAQVQQVVMNLVTNAAEAIGDREGTVVLRTSGRAWSAADLDATFPGQALAPGPHLSLEVEDDGAGMPAEVQARIFEPFFTTKFSGRGLGLSAMLGIVKGHHGGIHIDSEVGRGTRFLLLFPADAGPEPAAHDIVPAGTWRGHGALLLVEDEPAVREAAVRLAEDLGFDVQPAVDGREAVERFGARPGGFRVVLLDLTMPRMGGLEAARAIRRLDPGCPLVLASGYHEQTLDAGDLQPLQFLAKPFSRAELALALRTALRE